MADPDDSTEVVTETGSETSGNADDSLPDEVVLFAVSGVMLIATIGVFLVEAIPNGSAVMPGTICLGTALLGLRAYLR
jgi:hypothetical protein